MDDLVKKKDSSLDSKRVVQSVEWNRSSSKVTVYDYGQVYTTTSKTVNYREHIETTRFR